MIDNIIIKVTDVEKSNNFYKNILRTIHRQIKLSFNKSDNFHSIDYLNGNRTGFFWLSENSHDRVHFSFIAHSKEEVFKFFTVALASGGTANGPEGVQKVNNKDYVVYVYDPDGYNIEAVFHGK